MADSNHPSVSVVIPTLNRAEYIGQAIRSVLEQNESVSEILVVDGGSTDATREIAESFGAVIHWLPQEGKGAAGARNTGFRHARGSWIALLDSDDWWLKDKLRAQFYFLARHPGVDFIFGDMALVEAGSDNDTPEILDASAHQYLVTNAGRLDGILEHLFRFNFVPTSSVLFRKSCLEKVGFMDETLQHCEDYDYWLKFACRCRMGFVNQVLAKRRIHGGNTMRGAYLDNCEATLVVFDRMESWVANAPAAVKQARLAGISATHNRLGGYCFKRRDYSKAHTHLRAVWESGILPQGIQNVKFFAKLFWAGTARKLMN